MLGASIDRPNHGCLTDVKRELVRGCGRVTDAGEDQSRVVCTPCDLTLLGRYRVDIQSSCVAVIMSPALATRGLNKACSNLPNSQMLRWSTAVRLERLCKLKTPSNGQASCYLLVKVKAQAWEPVSGSHRGAVRAASAHAVKQTGTGSQQQAKAAADDFWPWPLTGRLAPVASAAQRGRMARPWRRLQGANLMWCWALLRTLQGDDVTQLRKRGAHRSTPACQCSNAMQCYPRHS